MKVLSAFPDLVRTLLRREARELSRDLTQGLTEDAPGAERAETGGPLAARSREDGGLTAESELTLEDQQALVRLYFEMSAEDDPARLEEVRRCERGRSYWKGKQVIWWNEQDGHWEEWRPLGASSLETDQPAPRSRRLRVANIYRAYGMALMSVLGAKAPTVRQQPRDASKAIDVAAAAAHSAILELFYRENQYRTSILQRAWLLYVDGGWVAYISHVQDPTRFGTVKVPIEGLQDMVVQPASVRCTYCGSLTELTAIDPSNPVCTGVVPSSGAPCGRPLDPRHAVPPQVAKVPAVVGYEEKALGQETVEWYGLLERRLQHRARSFRDSGYFALEEEVDVARLRDRFDRDDISSSGTGGGSGADAQARMARLNLLSRAGSRSFDAPGQTSQVVTYRQVWLRPWTFRRLEKRQRERLSTLYPDGLRMHLAGDLFLEARKECVDDFIVQCYAEPGDGQMRLAVGEPGLDAQDSYNDLLDIELRDARLGQGLTIVDSSKVDVSAIDGTEADPTLFYPVHVRDGGAIGQHVYSMRGAESRPETASLRREIGGPLMQQLLGTLPAAIGVGDPALKTWGAYSSAQQQAMGRIGIHFVQLQVAEVEIAKLVTKHFVAARRALGIDVKMVKEINGTFVNQVIRMEDLNGEVDTYPEVDEGYPITPAEKRQNLVNALNSRNPLLQAALGSLDNVDVLKTVLGLEDLTIQGEEARRKQLAVIQRLVQEQPQVIGTTQDPATGADVPMYGPSVMPDAELDDHFTAFQTSRSWLDSSEGRWAAEKNPGGYANVRLNALFHMQAGMQQAAAQAGAPPAGGEAAVGLGVGGPSPKGTPPPGTALDAAGAPRVPSAPAAAPAAPIAPN